MPSQDLHRGPIHAQGGSAGAGPLRIRATRIRQRHRPREPVGRRHVHAERHGAVANDAHCTRQSCHPPDRSRPSIRLYCVFIQYCRSGSIIA